MSAGSQYNTFRDLCLENADAAITAAELLAKQGTNHLAYHLATLSLEEIGKIFIGWYNIENEGKFTAKGQVIPLDDHIKKLFWAIWGPSFGKEKLTRQQMEDYKQMASAIHNRRLDTLYTDIKDTIPLAKKIGDQEIETLIRMVRARLNDSRLEGDFSKQMSAKDEKLFSRFMEVTNDADKRAFIFSDRAQEKLVSLNNFKSWVKWVLRYFETQDAELKKMLALELGKPVIGEKTQDKPKWKLRIKISTPSHVIKPQNLKEFNLHSPIIALSKGGDNSSLIVDFTLPEFIGIQILYSYGWMNARHYVAALCVASRGFFYWNTRQDTFKYYDKIWDLENDAVLSARLAQELKLDWPANPPQLDVQSLHLSRMVMDYFMDSYGKPAYSFIDAYMTGLAMLAKSDIHLRLETPMFGHFFFLLEAAVSSMSVKSDTPDFKDSLYALLTGFLTDRDDFNRVIDIGLQLKTAAQEFKGSITLTEVISLKMYCDILLLTLAYRHRSKDNNAVLSAIKE